MLTRRKFGIGNVDASGRYIRLHAFSNIDANELEQHHLQGINSNRSAPRNELHGNLSRNGDQFIHDRLEDLNNGSNVGRRNASWSRAINIRRTRHGCFLRTYQPYLGSLYRVRGYLRYQTYS